MEIRGNVFLITGGASGLGAALAQELGGVFVRCDVSREDDAQAAVDAATRAGSLRGLVNCAGIAPAAKTVGKDGAHPLDVFAKTIGVNLVGTFNMIRLDGAIRMQPK